MSFLIVGLANPGAEYARTRHNAGAWFIENIADHTEVKLKLATCYHGWYASTHIEQQRCHLLIPATFMNHSGQAVHACLQYHKIPVRQLLVVHDDLDLPVGKVQLKRDGGDGGHNGLKDVIRVMHTRQFHRLRIGIGHPGNKHAVHHYVLSAPTTQEYSVIQQNLQKAYTILPLIVTDKFDQAMQQLHTEI